MSNERFCRNLLASLLVAVSVPLAYQLQRAPKFREIFDGMLDGAALPVATEFVLNNWAVLLSFVALQSVLCGASLWFKKTRIWAAYVTGVTVAVFAVSNGLVLEAYFRPIIDITVQLTGWSGKVG